MIRVIILFLKTAKGSIQRTSLKPSAKINELLSKNRDAYKSNFLSADDRRLADCEQLLPNAILYVLNGERAYMYIYEKMEPLDREVFAVELAQAYAFIKNAKAELGDSIPIFIVLTRKDKVLNTNQHKYVLTNVIEKFRYLFADNTGFELKVTYIRNFIYMTEFTRENIANIVRSNISSAAYSEKVEKHYTEIAKFVSLVLQEAMKGYVFRVVEISFTRSLFNFVYSIYDWLLS